MASSDAGRGPAPVAGTSTGPGPGATAVRPPLPPGPAAPPPGPGGGRVRWILLVAVLVAVAVAVASFLVLRGGSDGTAADTAPRDEVRPTRTADPDHVPGTLYVSPDGQESGTGTKDAPFGSLETALQRLQPGDTLRVEDGEYRESIKDLTVVPGTPQERIRVEAAPGAEPVVRGLLWLVGADHWDIVNIDVRWDSRNDDDDHMVKLQGGTGWTLQDGELYDARSYAALLISGGANRFTVSGMYIHDTEKANGRNQDHLIYVNTDAQGGVIERNVLAGSPNGRAIKVGPPDDTDEVRGNVVIRYNTMVDNLGPSNVSLSYNVSGVEVYRNVMVGSGDGQETITTRDLTGDANVVRDNVYFGSEGLFESSDGILDGGGNVVLDPQFTDPGSGDYRPRNPQAAAYGAYAPAGS